MFNHMCFDCKEIILREDREPCPSRSWDNNEGHGELESACYEQICYVVKNCKVSGNEIRGVDFHFAF